MDLSIIVPAFNEATKIEHDLLKIKKYAEKMCSEILVVDDGSRDETRKLAEKFATTHSDAAVTIRVISYARNRGKGFAIRYGACHTIGDIIAFVDSGTCVPMNFLDKGIAKIREGYDFAIGSRHLKESQIKRHQPTYRRWGSKIFRMLMRLLMGIEFSDTQCGFKVYRGDIGRKLFGSLRTDGFMFDIEALRLAKHLKLRGAEFPVTWSNDGDTRYHPILGTWRNIKELLCIRLYEFCRNPS